MRPDPRPRWPDPAPRALREPEPLVPVAAGDNAGALRLALLEWKEQGRFGLLPVMTHLLASSVSQVAGPGVAALTLVPVPTSRRSRRARGTDLVDDLARGTARLLRPLGLEVQVRQALTYARTTADQAGLGHAERAVNVAGAFRVRSMRGLVGELVVVDDILTTGATVAEATRALAAAGRRPSGIAVVAATPRTTGAPG